VRQVGDAVRKLELSFWQHFAQLVPTLKDMDPAWLTVSTDAAVDSVDQTGFGGWWGSWTPGEREKTAATEKWASETLAQHVPFDSATRRFKDGGAALVTTWINKYTVLVGKLLAAITISGGAPSRSTELGSLCFVDGHGIVRNIFVLGGEFVLLQRYSKTAARSGEVVRPRFLLSETGQMLAAFCRVIVPMRTFVAVELGHPVHGSDRDGAESCIFSCEQSMRTKGPRDCLNAALRTIGMSVREYRLWQAGIVASARRTDTDHAGAAAATALLAGVDDAAMPSLTVEQRAAVEQANHTFGTAGAHYGRTAAAAIHGTDPGDIMPLYMVASLWWQVNIGLRKLDTCTWKVSLCDRAGRRRFHKLHNFCRTASCRDFPERTQVTVNLSRWKLPMNHVATLDRYLRSVGTNVNRDVSDVPVRA
jgi:hypothetical protein